QIRDPRTAESDDSVQRDRQPRDVGVLRLYRERFALVVPARRQAFRRCDRAAPGARLRAGDAVARQTTAAVTRNKPSPVRRCRGGLLLPPAGGYWGRLLRLPPPLAGEGRGGGS